jgi:CheY-like chemotaxis protein
MKKILIVDDNEASITLLLGILGDSYELSAALNGEDALEALDEELPDLILLDVVMDGINGIDLCREIKNNPTTKHIPIALLTATNKALSQTAKSVGADALIGKPFKVNYLLDRVKELLES